MRTSLRRYKIKESTKQKSQSWRIIYNIITELKNTLEKLINRQDEAEERIGRQGSGIYQTEQKKKKKKKRKKEKKEKKKELKRGTWMAQLVVHISWFQFRSWSYGLWDKAPCQGAYLKIIFLCPSPTLPLSFSQINKSILKKIETSEDNIRNIWDIKQSNNPL